MLDAPLRERIGSHQRDTRSASSATSTPGGRIPGWAVVHTHPQAERFADRSLQQRGYRTYLPLVTVQRRDHVLPTFRHTVQIPAFPRYLFVVIGSHWVPVRYTPGVHQLLMADGKPGIVPEAAVSALRAAEAQAATQQRADAQLAPGAPVAVARGPFAGAQAVVLSVGHLVRVALVMFGELRELSIQPGFLRLRHE